MRDSARDRRARRPAAARVGRLPRCRGARFASLVSTLLLGLPRARRAARSAACSSSRRSVTSTAAGSRSSRGSLLVGAVGRLGRPRASRACRSPVPAPPLRAVLGRPETALFLAAVARAARLRARARRSPCRRTTTTRSPTTSRASRPGCSTAATSGCRTRRPTGSTSSSRSPSSRSSSCSRPPARRVLYALPQYVAELAILVAVYGAARRLGFGVRAVGLRVVPARDVHARRARGDDRAERPRRRVVPDRRGLPAPRRDGARGRARRRRGGVRARGEADDGARAADPARARAAARAPRDAARAAAARSSRSRRSACGATCSTIDHTGQAARPRRRPDREHDLARRGRAPRVTALFLVYETMDRGGAHESGGALAGGDRRRRRRSRPAPGALLRRRRARGARRRRPGVALPFVAALLVIGAGWVLSWLSDRWGHPIRRPKGIVGPLNRGANEDTSAFGPLGAVLMYALPLLVGRGASRAARFDARRVALAASRAALPAPARARVEVERVPDAVPRRAGRARRAARSRTSSRRRLATHLVRGGRVVRRAPDDRARDGEAAERAAVELHARCGRSSRRRTRRSRRRSRRFQRCVPPHACVGAVLGLDEPAYLLYGPRPPPPRRVPAGDGRRSTRRS